MSDELTDMYYEASVEDDSGSQHEYKFLKLPADDGLKLFAEITQAGAGLGRLVGIFEAKLAGNTLAGAEIKFDGLAVEGAIVSFTQAILDKGGMVFVRRCFRGSFRDGVKMSADKIIITGEKKWAPEVAYVCNYGELFRAYKAWFEGQYRNLPTGSLKRLWTKLTAALPGEIPPMSNEPDSEPSPPA